MLKPKPRDKILKEKKKRTSQKEYQRDNKGEAFIDNDPLLSAAAKSAFDLAEARADEAAVALKAEELAGQFDNGTPLTKAQMTVLIDNIQQRINKHQKLDRIEAALIDDPDKNVYYMWGQIKRRCLKDDTIAWPHATAAKYGRCSRTQAPKIMNKLMRVGAVTRRDKRRVVVSSHTRSIAKAQKSALAMCDHLDRYFESLRLERFQSQELGLKFSGQSMFHLMRRIQVLMMHWNFTSG